MWGIPREGAPVMIWTDLIEEFPEDGYIHPLHEGKGHDGRKYRPVWHAVESTKNIDHNIVTDGGRDEHDDCRTIAVPNGNPAWLDLGGDDA